MSYTSWIEAVKSVGSWVESAASDKAKEAGLISKGGGAWAKEKGGPTVAKTVGDKLISVGDGEKPEPDEPEAEPEVEPAPSKPTGEVLDSIPKQNMEEVRKKYETSSKGYSLSPKEQIAKRIEEITDTKT
ncbi:MAG: hypothetical protein MK200_00975, partial [Nitrosopumilus sp.]|nr:hypothetical protein [Nitrosopumilus sp.]